LWIYSRAAILPTTLPASGGAVRGKRHDGHCLPGHRNVRAAAASLASRRDFSRDATQKEKVKKHRKHEERFCSGIVMG
jgi:hypothetical protein